VKGNSELFQLTEMVSNILLCCRCVRHDMTSYHLISPSNGLESNGSRQVRVKAGEGVLVEVCVGWGDVPQNWTLHAHFRRRCMIWPGKIQSGYGL
jgi:hypothetical protein